MSKCKHASFFRNLFFRDPHRWENYTRTAMPLTFTCRCCSCGEQQRMNRNGKWNPLDAPFKYPFEQELFDKSVVD
jgi:hypothetical protein